MRILLTGGTGFLGAHVCRYLLKCEHEVTVCIRASSNIGRLEGLVKDLSKRPIYLLYKNLDLSKGYDAVIHMATTYGRGLKNRLELIESNILMPLRLLEQSVSNKIGLFLNTDTYYTSAGLDHPLAAYVLSKRHFTDWAKVIADNKLKFVNLRIEHLYGPNDESSKFCTSIVKDCLLDKTKIELTQCDQLRDFIYIDDAASAYKTVLDFAGDFFHGWNEIGVGCGHAIPLRDFVLKVHSFTESKSYLNFGSLIKSPGEIIASKADNSFLIDKGWRCTTSLENGIRNTIDYVRQEMQLGNKGYQ